MRLRKAKALEADRILAELRARNGTDYETARPMPSSVYHSDAFAALEREKMFRQEWNCIGRAADLAEEGAFLTASVGDVPVLAVRQADGQIRCYLNACAHRFAKIEGARTGVKKRFVCPYHYWSYDLSGRLVRAPHMRTACGFEPGSVSLHELHKEVWEGFLYVTLAADPPRPLSERLQRVTDEVIGQYGMARYETVFQDDLPIAANWKNMIENFIESYHVFAVHAATFGTAGKFPDAYILAPDMDDCAFHWSAKEADDGLGAAHPGNTSLEGEWRRTTVVGAVFPNHLITLAPDYFWSITVLPVAPNEMRAVWSVAVAPEVLSGLSSDDRDAWLMDLRCFMDAANDEDKPVIEALFQGTQMTATPGYYHSIERNLWSFANYIERMTSG